MLQKLRIPFLLCAVVAATWPNPCDAYVERLHFPLSGHRGYATAKGSVEFAERFGDDSAQGTTLIIEVSNVPLPPGTELIVLVHEREVGTIKLNKQRAGRLVLESNFRKSVPRIATGSFVTVNLPGGSTVVW